MVMVTVRIVMVMMRMKMMLMMVGGGDDGGGDDDALQNHHDDGGDNDKYGGDGLQMPSSRILHFRMNIYERLLVGGEERFIIL
mgnify:CR=1 FL=1